MILREKPRKKRKFLPKLILWIMLLGIIYFGFVYFDDICNIFKEWINPSPSSNTTDDEAKNDNGDNSIKDDSPITSNSRPSSIYNDSNIDFSSISDEFSPPSINKIYEAYGYDAPVVLIIHSMANEAYSNGSDYVDGNLLYSDKNNVASIGKIIVDSLNEKGVNALHIDTLFNSGTILGSHNDLNEAIDKALREFPSITYVIDISRGVAVNEDLSFSKYVFVSDDISCACIDIILGFGEALDDSERDSFLLASLLSSKINSTQIRISELELISSKAPYTMRIDVGTYGNSFEEASASATILADSLVEILKEKVE